MTQPLVPRPWTTNEWLFWQFTASGDGPAYGVESLEIDLNYFNGDAQGFAQRFGVPVPPDPTPPDPIGTRYRVNAGTLNVREGPGTNFTAIGFLRRNEVVESPGSESRRKLAANPASRGWPDRLGRKRLSGANRCPAPTSAPAAAAATPTSGRT